MKAGLLLAASMASGTLLATEADTQPTNSLTEPQPEALSGSEEHWQTRKLPTLATCPGEINSYSAAKSRAGGETVAPEPLTTTINADSMPQSNEQVIRFEGNVELEQGPQRLIADEAQLDQSNDVITISGNVVFEDPNLILTAKDATKDSQSNTLELTDVDYLLKSNNGNGSAERVEVLEENQSQLTNTTFTTCPGEDKSWQISADQINLDQESGVGTAHDTVLRLGDVPVFYFPYFTFPLDDRRKTGFLFPSLSDNDRNGLDIEVPFYVNLAPNYDLTVTPRWLEERGVLLGSEFRHLGRQTETDLAFEYLASDNTDTTESGEDRWSYRVNNRTRINRNWSAGVDAVGISDDQYFRDFGNSLSVANRYDLTRQAYLRYRDTHWNFSGRLYEQEVLNSAIDRYKELPELKLSALYPDQFAGLTVGFESELTRFDRDDSITAERFDIAPSVSLPYETLAGFVIPKLTYRHTRYRQDNPFTDEVSNISRSLPQFSIDSGLVFERDIDWGGSSMVQTLEPRLYYLYVPERDQDDINIYDSTVPSFNFSRLFQDNRFVGLDRIGDANQISAAISSRILGDDGREKLKVGIGKIFFLRDREVQLSPTVDTETSPDSPILADIRYNFTESFSAQAGIEWDNSLDITNRGVISLRYQAGPNKILNVAHRVRRLGIRRSEETDLSFSWPINNRWSLVGRWNNDLINHRTIESLAGLEYESCCWAIRIVARRYLNARLDNQGFIVDGIDDDYNSGVYVQFVFKGLGGVGSGGNIPNLLSRSVYGYEDRIGL